MSKSVKFTAGGKSITSHSKTDSFGRKIFDELQLGTGFVSRQFSYYPGQITEEHKANSKIKSTATTQLVSHIILSDGRTISYEYDGKNKTTKVTDSIDGTTEYTYDALGQLLTEKVNGEVVNEMTYDNYGNITEKNGISYTYDTVWKDLLTGYGNQTISYDAQGNPTSYLGHTLTWEKGRQLKSFDSNTYTYNANGIRTSKTINGIKHEYFLDGTKILRETWGENVLIPLYDNEETVCGIEYNGEPFYFLKNLQGDIVSIVDRNADIVARYSYDAWGVCTVELDESDVGIANINPFRYRSYYFDAEIGMYYLQSRYYNPLVGRFINADDVLITLQSTINPICFNLSFYCINNPISYVDNSGYAAKDVVREIGRYTKESWIAWLLNKFATKRWNIINFNRFGFAMELFLSYSLKNPKDKRKYILNKNGFTANFKYANFNLGWGGKLEAKFGISIGKYSISFLRGIDWTKSYFGIYFSYTTKDGKVEFEGGLYISIAHLLKLAVAATIVGVCVVLPMLAPAFMSALAALSASASSLVGICGVVLNVLSRVTA